MTNNRANDPRRNSRAARLRKLERAQYATASGRGDSSASVKGNKKTATPKQSPQLGAGKTGTSKGGTNKTSDVAAKSSKRPTVPGARKVSLSRLTLSPKRPTTTGLTVPVQRAVDHCRVIVDGEAKPGEFTMLAARREVEEIDKGFVWLSLNQPDEFQMDRVAEEFGIHPLIVEDVIVAHQRPKIERYDDQLFFVVRDVHYVEEEQVTNTREIINTGEVQMIIGHDFIITIRHNSEPIDPLGYLAEDPDLRDMGPIALAWKIADLMVDEYARIAQLLSEEVDLLEEEVFTPGRPMDIEHIYMYKREIVEMRHATEPLLPALKALTNDHKDKVNKLLRSYFRDVLDHAITATQRVEGFDSRLTSLIDASVAKTTLQQNQDMRTISAVVGMAAVPTLIAGIYGMNFDNMPELHMHYGYPATLLVILLAVLSMYAWFKKNHWL